MIKLNNYIGPKTRTMSSSKSYSPNKSLVKENKSFCRTYRVSRADDEAIYPRART